MTQALIYDHLRTPRGRGRPNGSLHAVAPIELLTQALVSLRERNTLDTALLDDVVIGCVTPHEEQGANVARTAVLNADYAESVPGVQINRFCASGLEAVCMGAAKVQAGAADLVIGGGLESMSRVAMSSDRGAWPSDPQVAYHTYFTPQGIGADMIATLHGYSRAAVDGWAVRSQQLAHAAWEAGRFSRSVVPVVDELGLALLSRDELVRPDTTLESLGKLKPSFVTPGEKIGFDSVILQRYPHVERIEHVHHAGNSSGIVDGAAAMLIGNRDVGARIGIKPRARIRAFASVGSEPAIMLTGPSFAAEKVLRKAGMSARDIDLWEINEAFASVVMLFIEKMGIPEDRVNVNGGSIAMGHPLGATGAIILGIAVDELERRGLGTALVVLCVGAGMGTALIVERL